MSRPRTNKPRVQDFVPLDGAQHGGVTRPAVSELIAREGGESESARPLHRAEPRARQIGGTRGK